MSEPGVRVIRLELMVFCMANTSMGWTDQWAGFDTEERQTAIAGSKKSTIRGIDDVFSLYWFLWIFDMSHHKGAIFQGLN